MNADLLIGHPPSSRPKTSILRPLRPLREIKILHRKEREERKRGEQ